MKKQTPHFSEYRFHLWTISEVPSKAMSDHIEGCELCKERVAHYQEEQARFFKEHPTRSLERALEEKKNAEETHFFGKGAFGLWRWGVALLFFFVGVGGVGFWRKGMELEHPQALQESPRRSSFSERLKGVRVRWVVKRGTQQFEASPKFVFLDGDQLGLQMTASRDSYAMLVIVERQGQIQQWLPKPSEKPFQLRAGLPVTFSESVLLQRPIHHQGLYLLISPRPIVLAKLRQRVAGLAKRSPFSFQQGVPLPFDGYQTSRWISLP